MHQTSRLVILVALLFPAVQGPLNSQSPAGSQDLTPGMLVDRPIAEGERHAFQLTLSQGQGLKVSVDQLGADVTVEIDASPAPAVAIDDEQKRHYGRELLVWQAPSAGAVRLTVRGKSIMPGGGRYRMTHTVFEPGDLIARGVTALDDAERLSRPRQRASTEQAVQRLQQALQAWRALEDRELVAASLYRLGRLQARELQMPADAMTPLTEAVGIYEALGLHTEIAQTLGQLGFAHRMVGQPERELATHERAYEHGSEIDPLNRAVIEDDIAGASQNTLDFDRATTFGNRAVETFRSAGAHRDEFIALERLSQAYLRMRQFDDALRANTEAIVLGRKYGKGDDLGNLNVSIGRIHMAAGDDDAALAAFRHAIELYDAARREPSNRMVALLSIGRIYNRQGDSRRAIEVLEPVLARVPPQLREYWAAVASELGFSLNAAGEPARALDLQRKALEIVQTGSRVGEMTVRRDIAASYRSIGDQAAANEMIDRAMEIARALPGQPYNAMFLRERARNARAAGDLSLARQHYDAALEIIDSERGRLQSQALRASFGGNSLGYYTEAIDVTMQMHAQAPHAGHDAQAFALFERSRARSLTDLLAEARVDVRTGIDPALLDERRTLQQQLGDKDGALRDTGSRPAMKDRAAALEREIDVILRRLAVLDGRIRSLSPRHAALTRPAPASLGDTQQLLDDNTVLLAFSLGATTSWGWAVTRSSLRSFALPAAARIEEQARKVYADVTARQRPENRRAAQIARIDKDVATDADALSDLVLGPIATSLRGEWRNRRLAIVATGPLEYIPFAALPVPRAPGAGAAAHQWLVEHHELALLPSASVLALLRSDGPRVNPSRRVAVIADAVYTADDPRVGGGGRPELNDRPQPAAISKAPAASGGSEGLLRGLDDGAPRSGFGRLVFSREEAKAIAGLAPGGAVLEALDFSASLPTMTGPVVAGARIVHIASHGILNSARPELSGLVLSLVDRQGRSQQGVLRLYDVYNLKLSADLVVLSGCQTGLGRQMTGEGLLGLTRGFMSAGAPRVVASLWQVDDLATAEFMRRFYRGILVGKLTAAAALREAQRHMRADPRWRSPFYWAAFTLIGDWS